MMTCKDDNTLMEQVKQGDKTAYEEIVERHYKAGVIFACQIINDHHMAEDIVQDCFAKIYLMRSRYKSTFAFKTYLFTVIRNHSIDFMRKESRSETVDWDDSHDDKSVRYVEEMIINDEEKKRMYFHINNLKAEQKQLLYLFAIEGLSYKEIARITGQSVGQVKIKLFRCRQTLKLKMEEEKRNDR